MGIRIPFIAKLVLVSLLSHFSEGSSGQISGTLYPVFAKANVTAGQVIKLDVKYNISADIDTRSYKPGQSPPSGTISQCGCSTAPLSELKLETAAVSGEWSFWVYPYSQTTQNIDLQISIDNTLVHSFTGMMSEIQQTQSFVVNNAPCLLKLEYSDIVSNGLRSSISPGSINMEPIQNSIATHRMMTSNGTLSHLIQVFEYVSAAVQPYTLDYECVSCNASISFCEECSSPSSCTKCLSGYVVDVTGSCSTCEDLIDNCLSCDDYQNCTSCLNSSFQLNSSQKCELCNATLSFCEECSGNSCTKCSTNYYLNSGTCYPCEFFIDGCIECVSTTQCSLCQTEFFVDTNFQCSSCNRQIQNCRLCSNNTWCDTCTSSASLLQVDGGQFCISNTGCQNSVVLPNGEEICLGCAPNSNLAYNETIDECQCVDGYKFDSETVSCQQICGDGKLIGNQQCDDGNQKNDDGCNELCQTEDFYVCSKIPSECVLKVSVTGSFSSGTVYKYEAQNRGQVSVSLPFEPTHSYFSKLSWKQIVTFNIVGEELATTPGDFSYSSESHKVYFDVSYLQTIEGLNAQIAFSFQPSELLFQTGAGQFSHEMQLNGKNAPLVYEDTAALTSYEASFVVSVLIAALTLIHFLVASYFNKMLGIQIINTVQFIYFGRVFLYNPESTLLESMNSLQYINGYTEIFQQSEVAVSEQNDTLNQNFLFVGMRKNFLDNINLTLMATFLFILIFFYYSVRKWYQRKLLIQLKEIQETQKYKKIRRKKVWVYEHMVFPFTFYLLPFGIMSSAVYLQSSGNSSATEHQTADSDLFVCISQSANLVTMGMIFFLYWIECFDNYDKYCDQFGQPKAQTFLARLEYDQSDPNRANYHTLYPVVHLTYNLIVFLLFSIEFTATEMSLNVLQGLMAVGCVYLLILFLWKPYHYDETRSHSHWLCLNQLMVVIFLGLCLLNERKPEIFEQDSAILLMYGCLLMLGLIVAVGFIRLCIEASFRNKLPPISIIIIKEKEKQEQKKKKNKAPVFTNDNPYRFKNQISLIKQRLMTEHGTSIEAILKEEEKLCPFEPINEQQEYQILDRIIETNRRKMQTPNDKQLHEESSYFKNEKQQLLSIKRRLNRQWEESR